MQYKNVCTFRHVTGSGRKQAEACKWKYGHDIAPYISQTKVNEALVGKT
jgi:hypothetical protein